VRRSLRLVSDPGNPVQGGYLMKELLLVAAVVGLATTGCAQNRFLGNQGINGQASQRAPRLSMVRPAFQQGDYTPDQGSELDQVSDLRSSDYDEGNFDEGSYDEGGEGSFDEVSYDEGSCDDGSCRDDCCGDDSSGNCDSCSGDSCSSGDVCSRAAGRDRRLFTRQGWCDSCQGNGDLCSRVAGRVASGFCPHAGGYPESYNFTPSPPRGQTAYPYYTTRGPRDFLQANPPSIGPY